jgi:hypothetical protein
LQPCGILARHGDRAGRHLEAVLDVVGGVPDEEHQPIAHDLGPIEARPHQGTPDPLPAPRRIDRKGPEKERRHRTEPDRPVADGADDRLALAGDEAEIGDRGDADPVAVGGLAEPVGSEREIEQRLDARPVERAFGSDHEHGSVQRRAGEPVTRARPTFQAI